MWFFFVPFVTDAATDCNKCIYSAIIYFPDFVLYSILQHFALTSLLLMSHLTVVQDDNSFNSDHHKLIEQVWMD